MRTNPRQHILETWRSFARAVGDDDRWRWGGRDGSNSVSDAEQILCLLYPATEVPGFRLDRPDGTEDDVLAVLKPLGDRRRLPLVLLDAVEEYLSRYADEATGEPLFSGGSYLCAEVPGEEATPEQLVYDVTESYAVSVTLCLAAKGFLREFQRTVERTELRRRIDAVVDGLDRRLTAAMVGLLRSFVISVVPPDSEAEATVMRTVSQGRVPGRALMQDLATALQPVRDKLPELTFGLSRESEGVLGDYPDRLFECGWTWGVAVDATAIDLPGATGVAQPPGIAEARPSLPFTAAALESLLDLFSTRTSRQGLLNSDQQPLREALSLRWGLVLEYWSALGTFGESRWPVEDIPWETTDGRNSAYFTELVLGVIALDRAGSVASQARTQEVLGRATAVIEELAQRGRINRRAVDEDRGIGLHHPGVPIPLRGMERLGPAQVWYHRGYAPALAKAALRSAVVSTSRRTRIRLLEVADATVEHLLARRLSDRSPGLWDAPDHVFPGLEPAPAEPAWDLTLDAVEVFVTAAAVVQAGPVPDPVLADRAQAQIAEARHILDYELFSAPVAGGTQIQRLLVQARRRLDRAEALVAERPGTAAAVADEVLRELDGLASARSQAERAL